jgi:branched-chain amino acid transport system ATP-binding protein
MTALLEFDSVSLRFGGVNALSDVSFNVGEGELLAIIGPNGAGKTSIFNCLNGVYHPQQGSIRLGGTELIGRRPSAIAAMGVARTFQNLALFNNLNVIDNLMLGRHHLMRTGFVTGALWWGQAKAEEINHRRRCEEITELLELQVHRYARLGALPYGVKKRVELARALCMDPKLLLLDEPVAGMNLEETEDMARYILEVGEELSVATILVEHDMHMVMDIADRVVVLDFGQVIAGGTPAEVQANPAVIQAYLGTTDQTAAGAAGGVRT